MVSSTQRRAYLRKYFRSYNKKPARKAYLRAKQREYRSAQASERPSVMLRRLGVDGFRLCIEQIRHGA